MTIADVERTVIGKALTPTERPVGRLVTAVGAAGHVALLTAVGLLLNALAAGL